MHPRLQAETERSVAAAGCSSGSYPYAEAVRLALETASLSDASLERPHESPQVRTADGCQQYSACYDTASEPALHSQAVDSPHGLLHAGPRDAPADGLQCCRSEQQQSMWRPTWQPAGSPVQLRGCRSTSTSCAAAP